MWNLGWVRTSSSTDVSYEIRSLYDASEVVYINGPEFKSRPPPKYRKDKNKQKQNRIDSNSQWVPL